jgi:hypothetical protein
VSALRTWLRSAIERVEDDFVADPYLRYVLLLAVLTCGFGIWFRVPNFAGPDEYSRLIQPMKVAGRVAADPGFASLQSALLDGRALGATFYLFGLVLAPLFVVVLLAGQLGEFVALGGIESRWELWHAAPTWFWSGSILLGRLVTVAFGVGCVYLTYRIGTEFRDRATGRLAALFLSLSVGFVAQAHELNEDIPSLFFLLLTVLLATRYARRGDRALFFAGALTGGLAIAFKLSGGVAAVALGIAHLDRARRADDPVEAFLRPTVVVGGLGVGLLTVYVGIPSVLVGGPGELLGRATRSIVTKTAKTGGLDAPISYWFLRQYVRGLGVPLFLAAVAGALAVVGRTIARRRNPSPLAVLLGTTVLTFLVVYSRWEFVRLRHLVPTFPVLLVALSAELARWREGERTRRGASVVLALLVVTSGATVAVAEYEYVTDPRDGATDWLANNADRDATVEVYENSIADVGVPHGQTVSHYPFPENRATNTSSLVLNETAYTGWMLGMPDRSPEYVQLTAAELAYVTPTSPASDRFPERRRFVERLQRGEYNYTRVATFGEPSGPATLREDLIEAALDPDLPGRERYVAIYERSD